MGKIAVAGHVATKEVLKTWQWKNNTENAKLRG